MGMSSYASQGPSKTITFHFKVANVENAAAGMDKLARGMTRIKKSTHDMGNGMQANVKITDKLGKGQRKLDRETSMTWLKKGPKFRMEMLSIMFMGMALQRTFSGLLEPALKAVGVFELWGVAMEILFLPFALSVMDFVVLLIEKIGEMPEWKQWWLGVAMAIALVGAALMVVIGQLDLFIGALGSASIATHLSNIAASFGIGAAGKSMLTPVALGGGNAALTATTVGLATGASVAALALIGSAIANAFLNDVAKSMGRGDNANLLDISPILPKFEVFGQDVGAAVQMGIDRALAFVTFPDFITAGTHNMLYGGQKQFGGVIPREGMYHLHAGETVSSPSSGGRGEVVFAPVINATGFSDSMLRDVANRLYSLMRQDLITQTGRY